MVAGSATKGERESESERERVCVRERKDNSEFLKLNTNPDLR